MTTLTPMARLERAEQLLAEVASIPDAVDLINLAEAARVYAQRMKLGTLSVNHATEIKVRAELRMAEIIAQGQKTGTIARPGGMDGGRPRKTSAGLAPVSKPDTLADLGVDRSRASEAKALRSAFTDEEITQRIRGSGPTRSGYQPS